MEIIGNLNGSDSFFNIYVCSATICDGFEKKIIRIILKVSFNSHTDALFKEQMIFKFPDIYLYQIGKFMYLFKKRFTP